MPKIFQDPIYGEIKITEPVLLELIATPQMQRLRGVDQMSVHEVATVPWGSFSRFDHSVGVMHLIKLLGGDLEEQVAGLLHDVSHTAFSHMVDFAFGSEHEQDFHEKQVERVIFNSKIPQILEKHGFVTKKVITHENYSLLEQELPRLCADRVDYSLKTFHQKYADATGYPIKQVRELLNYLENYQGEIVFNNQKKADEFARMYLWAETNVWGGSYIGDTIYHLFGKIIKQAFDKGTITIDDLFSTDRELLNKLKKTESEDIKKLKRTKVEKATKQNHDLHINAKMRYVDPPVKINDKIKPLTHLDPKYKQELTKIINRRKDGFYVKITE